MPKVHQKFVVDGSGDRTTSAQEPPLLLLQHPRGLLRPLASCGGSSSSNWGSTHLANKLDSNLLKIVARHCDVRKVNIIITVSPPLLWNHFKLVDEKLLQDSELKVVVFSRLVIVDDAFWVVIVTWWAFFRDVFCFNSWSRVWSRVERKTLLILVYLDLLQASFDFLQIDVVKVEVDAAGVCTVVQLEIKEKEELAG